MKSALSKVFIFLLLVASAASVQAGVIVGGTRLIYHGEKKESSISVSNPDKTPYLIQSWVDNENSKNTGAVPFVITPPLFRLDDGADNVLRVVRVGGNLPENKESLFWLNVKSIPSAEKKDNSLQIAIKTRIKLIYRPMSILGNPEEAAGKLKWQRVGNSIQVVNPTPFYITFYSLKVNGRDVPEATMVAPMESVSFPESTSSGGSDITWRIINDYGSTSKEYRSHL